MHKLPYTCTHSNEVAHADGSTVQGLEPPSSAPLESVRKASPGRHQSSKFKPQRLEDMATT
jgi:hypothetical protein